MDRTATTRKHRGGGVCAFVSEKWCHNNNIHVHQEICTPDIELLSLKIRPYYLPREFPIIFLNIVYIPPQADKEMAQNTILNVVNEQQNKSPDAPILVTGDFNHCSLNTLKSFEQYVHIPTRQEKTLDLCYGNVADAYKCSPLPPLGDSDHLMLYMQPKYKPLIKRSKPTQKTVNVWDPITIEKLRGCFECTDWNMFIDSCSGINELTESVTQYIKFCEDEVCEKKTVKIYPNSKPWVNSEITQLLKLKSDSYKRRCDTENKEITSKLKKAIHSAKLDYKNKLEETFKTGNSRETWARLKTIVGYNSKKPSLSFINDNNDYANTLNTFYTRFEDQRSTGIIHTSTDYSQDVRTQEHEDEIKISEKRTERVFRLVNQHKACGPDGIKGKILKQCSSQLCHIFTYIFNMSLQCHTVPDLWKCSEIIPVPKKSRIKEPNDLRPVALTPIVMKCFERLILKYIKAPFSAVQDPLQFAYRERRSVEDAIVVFLDKIYKHLDTRRKYCRILFVDFSSAFNTIRPNIIIDRLSSIGVNNKIILWIQSFLYNRTQYVKLNDSKSSVLTTNIGVPQGCVLSPILFTTYTDECRLNNNTTVMIKFADDTAILGLLETNEDESRYKIEIERFTSWCTQHFLTLNLNKTKEIIIDFRKKKPPICPLYINNKKIEQVTTYKYLGITMSDRLDWQLHSERLRIKMNQRLYFLRKLKEFNVDNVLLSLFYKSTIESIITFCVTAWAGNLQKGEQKRIDNIINRATKLTGHDQVSLHELYSSRCIHRFVHIDDDATHPLRNQIIKSSHRTGRIRHLMCNTERYRLSFLPSSIRFMSLVSPSTLHTLYYDILYKSERK